MIVQSERLQPGALDHGNGRVTFVLYAPGKSSVHLIGDFNQWDRNATPLEGTSDGYWWTEVHLASGNHNYQFVLDGDLVICDPYARGLAEGAEFDPPRAVVEVGAEPYTWRHNKWDRPRFEDLIIYEMHVGDFTPQRSFRAAMDKLDYLQDLGINAIELMPIFEFVGEEASWGYDPAYFFTVEKDYGTPDELRELIDEAHARGIAIILDIVLAHTAKHHPFFKMYPYEKSPWYGPGLGEQNRFGLPALDYSKEATQIFARDVIEYWINEFHVDGFRYDYLIGIGQKGDMGVPLLVRAARDSLPEAFLIGEYSPEDPEATNTSGLNAAWHVAARYALMTMLREGQLNDYNWDEFDKVLGFIDARNQGYAESTMVVNFIESHDEWRAVYELCYVGFRPDLAMKKSALGATVLFTLPGPPMLYHGQEWGEPTECSLDANPIHWERLEGKGSQQLFNLYRKLCRLRRANSALRSENFSMEATVPEQKTAVFRRWSRDGGQVMVIVNFSPASQTVDIHFPHGGIWRDGLDGGTVHIESENKTIDLAPHTAKIYLSE